MGKHSHNKTLDGGIDRVDGMAKVTGTAKYSAEYDLQGLCYAVLVGSTIFTSLLFQASASPLR